MVSPPACCTTTRPFPTRDHLYNIVRVSREQWSVVGELVVGGLVAGSKVVLGGPVVGLGGPVVGLGGLVVGLGVVRGLVVGLSVVRRLVVGGKVPPGAMV